MKTFDGTPIATIRSAAGIPFTMRLVRQSDAYGRNMGLTHDKPEPLVEFYDARYVFRDAEGNPSESGAEFGQFVSRYYLKTLRNAKNPAGLILDGGVDAWRIDRDAFDLALSILANWTAWEE